jgi:3-oxoacyl-[acyl-carrier protein] reductase
MFSLDSQYALVTGASRGIGQAIAITLAKQGAWVAGTSTHREGAEQFSQQLRDLNLQGQGFVLDVTQTESRHTLFTTLKKLDKLPTILINNAGITRDNLALRLKAEDWQSVIETNLSSAFHMTQLYLMPMLKVRYGRIIQIGSIIGSTGNPGQTHYAAAKAGIIGFSKSLAREVASRGVTVNIIAPGFIDTHMTQSMPEPRKTEILNQIPVQTLGHPQDVANACIFLASKESAYITGHTLHVNGGLFME